MEEIYFPAEDSTLLAKHVKEYSKGLVLDMGTGSGIQAKIASENCDKVIAVDINEEAIEYCEKHNKHEKIEFRKSDLFSKVKEKFDLIIFNPPYLPMDKEDEAIYDVALFGGKKGWEVVEKFLIKAKEHLNKKGKILLLISSLTDKNKVEEVLLREDFIFNVIDELKLDFERLYVYDIRKR